MQRCAFTLSGLAVLALFAAPSCQQPDGAAATPAISRAKTVSRCNQIDFRGPLRMFSSEGEVTSPAVIRSYQDRHGLAPDTEAFVYERPENVYSNHSERLRFGPGDGAKADVVIMRQHDTGALGQGTPQATIDHLFDSERDFLAVREQLLEMSGCVSSLDRVDERNFRLRESFHVRGTVKEDHVSVPYTFIASRTQSGAYPYALKRAATPDVPAGDTVLVREGFLALR